MNYAILDIETTGGNPQKDKMTEIAVYIHDGKRIVNQYHSIINPERKIPYFISKMTGITDDMVANAPRFFEVAKTLVDITENCIVVAHNASFDYNFIKAEFKSLGYYYQRDYLCTVKLSRKIIPGKSSYSLGKLCRELGISIENRHRAQGDALATVKLFELLIKTNPGAFTLESLNLQSRPLHLNAAVSKSKIDSLPDETGIYYLLDDGDQIIYVGKSRNIKKRVLSHLSGNGSKKSLEMVEKIADIDYELTGSELLALIRESEEIKLHSPVYNSALRKCSYGFGLYSYKDEKGYLCLRLEKNGNGSLPHTSFGSLQKGKDFLFNLTEKYNLCQNLTGLFSTNSACFQYALKVCRGACIGIEEPDSYNERVNEALEYAGFMKDNLIVLDQGRMPGENSFIMIENGRFLGYGYADAQEALMNPEDFKQLLVRSEDNRDARVIISGFLRNKRTGKRIIY